MWNSVDAGNRNAGYIALTTGPAKPDEASSYRISVNKNLSPNVQFATLAHELAHLFLGHLGQDKYLKIPVRPALTHAQRELEAESTAYIVCARNGVNNQSDSYLTNYVKQDTIADQLDLYQIMRAAGQIESLLGLAAHTKLDRPPKWQSETPPIHPGNSTELFDNKF